MSSPPSPGLATLDIRQRHPTTNHGPAAPAAPPKPAYISLTRVAHSSRTATHPADQTNLLSSSESRKLVTLPLTTRSPYQARARAANAPASDAIEAPAGSISHHHGVGIDQVMSEYIEPLAELLVRFGANVQPGQVVAISTNPGKEQLTRALARHAYAAGAKYVDVITFDPQIKRARLLGADPDTLGYVPPWLGERMLALGELRAATINLSGPADPHVLDGIDPELAGRDMLPRVKESTVLVQNQLTNWTIGPGPTPGWAKLVYPDLDPEAALARLWTEIAHVCRLDEPDPIAAWDARLDQTTGIAARLTELQLDALHYSGPGTELTVGLLPGSHWEAAKSETAGGIVHAPNLPTEEVFTTPDPERADGTVTSTKPLFTSGALITGLQVRFEGGRAVEITADQNAATLRTLTERDAGGARLGEVALVDRDSRIGQLGTVFYDTLLDENAASHIALGQGFTYLVDGENAGRINNSEIHIDFMIGRPELEVTGITRDGGEIPLLRDGAWQL
jgi:aminopeptidase